jgi:hypothetical protein
MFPMPISLEPHAQEGISRQHMLGVKTTKQNQSRNRNRLTIVALKRSIKLILDTFECCSSFLTNINPSPAQRCLHSFSNLTVEFLK